MRGRDTGRGRSRVHAGSLTQNSIRGPQDHALGQRRSQTAEPPGLPNKIFLKKKLTVDCECTHAVELQSWKRFQGAISKLSKY